MKVETDLTALLKKAWIEGYLVAKEPEANRLGKCPELSPREVYDKWATTAEEKANNSFSLSRILTGFNFQVKE